MTSAAPTMSAERGDPSSELTHPSQLPPTSASPSPCRGSEALGAPGSRCCTDVDRPGASVCTSLFGHTLGRVQQRGEPAGAVGAARPKSNPIDPRRVRRRGRASVTLTTPGRRQSDRGHRHDPPHHLVEHAFTTCTRLSRPLVWAGLRRPETRPTPPGRDRRRGVRLPRRSERRVRPRGLRDGGRAASGRHSAPPLRRSTSGTEAHSYSSSHSFRRGDQQRGDP